jgi:hypothetical protein
VSDSVHTIRFTTIREGGLTQRELNFFPKSSKALLQVVNQSLNKLLSRNHEVIETRISSSNLNKIKKYDYVSEYVSRART